MTNIETKETRINRIYACGKEYPGNEWRRALTDLTLALAQVTPFPEVSFSLEDFGGVTVTFPLYGNGPCWNRGTLKEVDEDFIDSLGLLGSHFASGNGYEELIGSIFIFTHGPEKLLSIDFSSALEVNEKLGERQGIKTLYLWKSSRTSINCAGEMQAF